MHSNTCHWPVSWTDKPSRYPPTVFLWDPPEKYHSICPYLFQAVFFLRTSHHNFLCTFVTSPTHATCLTFLLPVHLIRLFKHETRWFGYCSWTSWPRGVKALWSFWVPVTISPTTHPHIPDDFLNNTVVRTWNVACSDWPNGWMTEDRVSIPDRAKYVFLFTEEMSAALRPIQSNFQWVLRSCFLSCWVAGK